MELTAAEGRVLGCLIEQEALAPAAVPVTLNNLRLSCNQATGRDPVVAYDDRTVEDTLLALKSRGLARFVPPSADAPTTRYRHRADERWRMDQAALAVLAVLLVRRVLTRSEVRVHAERLHPEITPSEVDAVLDALAARTPRPFAARVPGRPGDEVRWVEVLTGPPPAAAGPTVEVSTAVATGPASDRLTGTGPSPYAVLAARVADLERRLAEALDRAARPARDRPPPPPPPPPVELAAPARHLVATTADRRGDARRGSRGPVATTEAVPGLVELADRLRDVEHRLARIEAELGALR
ncbi:MAG TPA: DUF480 domain-containing protein [Acidimicrobiales bacterium]|nr:DUF480 domain-containing protein [Acidimicrobiales bacterium]